ncbi:MAG: hypothetical protein EXS00_03570 [Phycisphaerales bacterium]|nr:hypothetical protein [Phycisphaerales bacterium]
MNIHEDEPFNWMAGALGWLLPGLGQIWLGHKKRGVAIMGGVLSLFLGGVLLGGVDCVDRTEDRLWFVAQAGAGPIAFIVDWTNGRFVRSGELGEMVATPPSSVRREADARVSSFKGFGIPNEIGTLYCALAGLMNVVVVLDALGRCRLQDEAERAAP